MVSSLLERTGAFCRPGVSPVFGPGFRRAPFFQSGESDRPHVISTDRCVRPNEDDEEDSR